MNLPNPPPGWSLTHLIWLDPDWQVNICDGEHVAIGTGDTPYDAIISASSKAEDGAFAGRLAWLDKKLYEPTVGLDVLATLGLTPPKKTYLRR